MANDIPEAVFLDTQVFDSASFNFDTKSFTALGKHLQSGRLRLVLTDITISEVKSRIAKNIDREIEAHEKFVNTARVLKQTEAAKNSVTKIDASAAVKEMHDTFDRFVTENKAEVLDAMEQDVPTIFERYFEAKPPFGPTTEKHREFPDAFVSEALKEWTEANEQQLFVVSDDALFREACDECPEIHVKKTLVELLDHVASDDEKLSNFIREQLHANAEKIGKEAGDRFEELGFWVIDEWADIEVEVTKVTLSGEPEIIDIGVKEANAQLVFDAEYEAAISYEDSTTGVYDSEEGRMMFMETRDVTARKKRELVVDVHLTFNGLDPDEFEVDEVDLVEPAKGYGIRLPAESYD